MRVSRTARRVLAGAIAAATLAATAACASTPGDEEVYELSWSSYLGPNAHMSLAMQDWIDKVEERSGGRITVEPFFLESLCATLDGLACAKDGRADIAYTAPGFHPELFPLASAVSVPFVTEDPIAQIGVSQDFYESDDAFRAQFDDQGVTLLYFTPTTPAVLGAKQEFESIDDIRGLSIRGTARLLNALQLIGVNGVNIPVTEIYESVNSGTVDAWYATTLDNAILDYKLGEVTKYMYDTGAGVFINGMAVMNSERLASLPEDLQEVIAEVSAEVFGGYEQNYLKPVYDATCDGVEEAGVELGIWSDAAKRAWRAAVEEELQAGWIEQAQSNGVADAAEFLERYQAAIEDAPQSDLGTPISYCLGR